MYNMEPQAEPHPPKRAAWQSLADKAQAVQEAVAVAKPRKGGVQEAMVVAKPRKGGVQSAFALQKDQPLPFEEPLLLCGDYSVPTYLGEYEGPPPLPFPISCCPPLRNLSTSKCTVSPASRTQSFFGWRGRDAPPPFPFPSPVVIVRFGA